MSRLSSVLTQRTADEIAGAGKQHQYLPIDKIVKDVVNIRVAQSEGRNKTSFEELKKSIQAQGILQPLLVRPGVEDDGTPIPNVWFLVCGMQRITAAKDLGLETVPCVIDTTLKTPQDVALAQITENTQRISNSPKELADHCLYLAAMTEERDGIQLTQKEIASIVNKTEAWVSQTLKLTKLVEEVKAAMDQEEIPVTVAKTLARLPDSEQVQWMQNYLNAETDGTTSAWRSDVEAHYLACQKALAEGRKIEGVKGPVPKLRTVNEIKEALEITKAGGEVLTYNLDQNTLEWCLQIDKVSIERTKADVELQKLYKEEEKAQKQMNQASQAKEKFEELRKRRIEREKAIANASKS